jgi:hypothetical protein
MLSQLQFKTFIFNLISLLVLVSLVLMGLLEYKSWTTSPDIFVLQSKFDGNSDRIVKTKGSVKDFDTIYTSPDIQDFEATKNQLLVTIGIENQESKLKLINIKTKETKDLNYPNKFVGEIKAGNDKFVILVEDLKDVNGVLKRSYRSKLAMVTEEKSIVEDLNPQFLATQADSIHINPSSSLLVFTGVGNSQYLLDLNDVNNISKLNNVDTGLNYGFVNDNQLYLSDYSLSSETRIKFLDLVKDESSYVSLFSENYSQLAISFDTTNIYYTQNKNVSGDNVKSLKDFKTGYVKYDPSYSFDNIKISTKDLFMLFEKVAAGTEYSKDKDFAIYNLKIKYLPNDTISGSKAIWVK